MLGEAHILSCILVAATRQEGRCQETPAAPVPTVGLVMQQLNPAKQAGDSWADSVPGGLEANPPCEHCLMRPCITVSEITHIQRSCAPDITNHSKRRKNYHRFWKSFKDRGLWQDEAYLQRKTSYIYISSQKVFDDAIPRYQKALDESGYNHKLTYNPQPMRNRNCKRKVIWYNPPWNANVKTNLGRKFINIIDRCFPNEHPLHKIFDKHTLKLSCIRASSRHTTRQSYQISTSHKHKQVTKNATVEKKMENASHKMSFTKPQSRHKHHQTHTWALPSIGHKSKRNETELSKHI